MPPNRRAVDRAEKEAALLDAAEEAFVRDGWDGSTIATIARAAGVTGTTVHWYFSTKDDLLAAVVRRWADVTIDELERAARRLPRATVAGLVVTALDQLQPLVEVLHERAARSDVVAEVHESVHRRLTLALGPDPAAVAFVLLVEAVLSHAAPAEQEVLLGHAVTALTTG